MLVSYESIGPQVGNMWSAHDGNEMHGCVLAKAVEAHLRAIAVQLGVAVKEVDWCLQVPYCDAANEAMVVRKPSPLDACNEITGALLVSIGSLKC